MSPVNKRLNFEVNDDDDEVLIELNQFDLELESADLALDEDILKPDNFSPCRTRSGLVYESGLKKHRFRLASKQRKNKERSRTHSGQSTTGSLADCSENESETSNTEFTDEDLVKTVQTDMEDTENPPPLNYNKVPISRFNQMREILDNHDIPSSPISSYMAEEQLSPAKQSSHGKWPREQRNIFFDSPLNSPSPPSHTMRAMRLFEGLPSPNSACAISSPQTAPRLFNLKSRLLFDDEGEPKRFSYPGTNHHFSRQKLPECDSTSSTEKTKSANINPFTPEGILAVNKKRSRSQGSINSSFSPSTSSLQKMTPGAQVCLSSDEEEDERFSPLPTKRVRMSDINITRYQEEFLELAEIASGQFGVVKKARHRLDGIVYAIKISKTAPRKNSHDEKMAMNEVFAHAALMKHKHVVRYYNSWVEKGAVYIQNEYCEGGSLQKKIEDYRANGLRFSEVELCKIMAHVAKGLQYIHSKQLVHLDIKPGNIFISFEHDSPSPQRIVEQMTDSGAASGDFSPRPVRLEGSGVSSGDSSPGEYEKVHYKIGDLGHVAPIYCSEVSPEEGDCRYMAPEFLQMDVDPSKLTKADIFSLGLTIYEAASLRVLPRNSLDDPNYENIKRGKLHYMDCYSEDFNNLLSSMVNTDPSQRPTAARIIASNDTSHGSNKSRAQLNKELKEMREKLLMLEQQLSADKERKSQRKTVMRNKQPNYS